MTAPIFLALMALAFGGLIGVLVYLVLEARDK